MASTDRRGTTFGVVQIYALVFGIAYLGVALLEDVLGSNGLKIGGGGGCSSEIELAIRSECQLAKSGGKNTSRGWKVTD